MQQQPLPTGLERYQFVRELGIGNFGVAKLARDIVTGELLAIKFIERGEKVQRGCASQACMADLSPSCQVDKNVEREILNHRMLNHPNIVAFKEVSCRDPSFWRPSTPRSSPLRPKVFLTSHQLGIVMEYASGGELFERISKAGRFVEDEARCGGRG